MTTTAALDPASCVLETYEAHTPPEVPDGSLGTTRPVLVCRAHGWTTTLEPGTDAEGPEAVAAVAQHHAALTGRVLHAEGGTLVVEVRDPSLYEHPGLVEDLRVQFRARNVVGIDPQALHLYVTPDDDAVAAMLSAMRARPAQATGTDGAEAILRHLAEAGVYLVRVPRRAD